MSLQPAPISSQINLSLITHIIYALHALSVISGIIGSAFIITSFLTGWPSIIAIIINYTKREAVQDTFLDSHFNWQIRTFWFACLWMVFAIILFISVLGIFLSYIITVCTGIWVSYRIIRGWLTLNQRRPMPI
ncbi:MAG: hypothetical protein CMH70_06245 [Nitrosomonadaceae bacterium]|nr:hypothetical protein [Nitrosomonadaceae bacterium]